MNDPLPPIVAVPTVESLTIKAVAMADTRYSFVGQHLEASAIFIRRLREIEATPSISEAQRCEHRGLVCAVIFQCAATLETESHEVCVYGPSSYLGPDRVDRQSQAILEPIADVVDDQPTIERYNLILHILRKRVLDRGNEPFQSAALLVRLRNELVHYKSRWGAEMATSKLFATLETLIRPPTFIGPGSTNFFPHRCLSAHCAQWAQRSTIAFLDAFYTALGVPSRFDSYRERLNP